MANFFESNQYLEALKRVNVRMQAATERKVNLFGETWYQKHFTVNQTPHPTNEFKTILQQMNLPIAASTINQHSAEPLRAKDGLASIEQNIFTFAHGYRLDIDELRELMLMQQIPGQQQNAMNGIIKKILEVNGKCIDGVHARIDIMTMGALSNAGKFTFTKQNDPSSPFIGTTVDFGFDGNHDYEESDASLQWKTANAASSAIDPIKLIDNVCKMSPVKLTKILTDKSVVNFLTQCATMKGYLNNQLTYPNMPISLAGINTFLASHDLPTIEVVQRRVRVQDGATTHEFEPWKAGKLLFVPSDNFGTIETGMTDNEMGFPSEGVTYGHYGRIETSRFRLGEKEHSSYAEIFKARISAVPCIPSIRDMYSVDVKAE